MKWFMSANSATYDHSGAFSKFGYIDWRTKCKLEIGDIVYLYLSKPVMEIRYKAIATKINMLEEDISDDREFWVNSIIYNKSKNIPCIRMKLLKEYDDCRLSYRKLMMNGLGTAQGTHRINEVLSQYLDSVEK